MPFAPVRPRAAALALVVALAWSPVAQAQAARQTHADRVDELTRVLGRAHYLRALCNGKDDQTWRNFMLGMLAVEAKEPSPRRTALIDQFNAGYRYEEERFPACSSDAEEASRELSAEGRRLADGLAARFRE